ncbi:5-formyltetrahydrofolate cyclo-ligase [Metabacillus sp. Hm71]|uniref:5-formyltetrahydrofolate cyclo-ligase n=1 Tax=Metabacillus sp. Hm71 TaxID=3450743 RepID=UPI003F42652D
MEKKDLRKLIKNKLAEMTEDEYWNFSKDIQQRLFCLPAWNNAHTIAVTISTGQEVDTKGIIEKAWEEKKRVVVPKCDPAGKTMAFRQITSFDQLEPAFFGLLEPKIEETVEMGPRQIDLIIVPGICFDRKRYRIGYGGGYYDRYLTKYTNDTLSLAFSMQMVEKVPREKHDIPVSKILTECEEIS